MIYRLNPPDQVSEEQYNKVLDLVESGKKEGASVTCGGNKWGAEGYFVEPTVFAGVTDEMRIAKEEVRVPVKPPQHSISYLYTFISDFWSRSNYFQIQLDGRAY